MKVDTVSPPTISITDSIADQYAGLIMKNIQSCHRKLRQGGRDLLAGHRTRRQDPPESVNFYYFFFSLFGAILLFLLQSFRRNFGMRLLSPSFVFGALRAISSFLAPHLISKMHM